MLQLRKIVFGIYKDPSRPMVRPVLSFLPSYHTFKDVEEVYDFRITYPTPASENSAPVSISMHRDDVPLVSSDAHSKKEIKKATQRLLRSLVTLTQTLKVRFSLFFVVCLTQK